MENNGIMRIIFSRKGFDSSSGSAGKLVLDTRSPLRHVLWGWLQIDKVLKIDGCNISEYEWARYHPHFHRDSDANNTLYIACRYLTLPGESFEGLEGAGNTYFR